MLGRNLMWVESFILSSTLQTNGIAFWLHHHMDDGQYGIEGNMFKEFSSKRVLKGQAELTRGDEFSHLTLKWTSLKTL